MSDMFPIINPAPSLGRGGAMPISPRIPPATVSPVQMPRGLPGGGDNPMTTHREQPIPTGFNEDFSDRWMAMRTAMRRQGGDAYIFSGPRTPEEQQGLLDQALTRYGDMKEAMKRVKAPGKSSHDPSFGLALGLGPGALGMDIRGDLKLAYELAPRYGLSFPSTSQPWHMELAGLDKIRT